MLQDQPGPEGTGAVTAIPAVPEHVAIVGLGPSAQAYIDLVERSGGRHAAFDEVWVINTYGDVLGHDRVFLMDDVANVIRETTDENIDEKVRAKLSNMLTWLRTHPGPIYTSLPHSEFPGLVVYPLEDVINSVGTAYFNNSVAYAVVFAIHLGVKRISLFGCDYSYGKAMHEGTGRACVEFWLGVAAAKGIHISVAQTSSLMDANAPERKFYGYEAVDVEVRPLDETRSKVTLTPRKEPLATMDRENQ